MAMDCSQQSAGRLDQVKRRTGRWDINTLATGGKRLTGFTSVNRNACTTKAVKQHGQCGKSCEQQILKLIANDGHARSDRN